MRAFLQALRKKLTDVMRRLRALALRFTRRSQPAERKRTQPEDGPLASTASVQSTASPDVEPAGVPPTGPAPSSATEEASAQSFEPEAGATPAAAEIEPRPVVATPGPAELPSTNAVEAEKLVAGEAVPETPNAEAPVQPVEQLPTATSEPSPSESEAVGPGSPETPPATPLEVAQTTGENVAPELASAREAFSRLSTPREEPEEPRESPSALLGEVVELEQREKPEGHPAAGDAGVPDGAEAAPRRPSPECYEQPFVGPGLGPLSKEYAVWNKAVVQHCLLADAAEDQEVYLTITPRILAGALSEVADVNLTPEEAEVRFADTVSAMYRTRVLPHARKLQVLRRCGDDGLPECAAFLALSVLAAYRMHTDEGAAANAYYKRLDELLLCGLSGGLPRGFDPDEFEGLWLFLRAWLDREHGRQMAMPRPDVGLRRYVALSLTHVPLRQVDIERLPDFFDWAGYEAGERVPIERIDADLSRWALVRDALTNAGMDALGDERRPAVLAQIVHELECWDGSHTDTQGRRTAPVEVFLQWERRIPLLSYLPRRPAAFPAVFNDGTRVFDAGQDGWYEPLPIGFEDGPELQSGFSWEAASNGIRIVLRRIGASTIAMAPSEFAGPISHNGLLLGALGAALCEDALVVPAQQYLESVTGKRCVPVQLPSMPGGWTLFTGINPVRRLPPPDGLEALDIVTNAQIIPQGGLRLGRRWAWLAEAPPKLLVAGFDPSERAAIDGEPVDVDDGGVVRDEGRLTRPGVRVVEIGRVRRRLEIVDPEVAVATFTDVAAIDVDRRRVAALPSGSWTVIGARPGEAAYAVSRSWSQGALVCCSFDPVWAMSYGCRHGALVLCLVEQPPLPNRLPRPPDARLLRRMQAWAEAVYNANIRRPAFGSPWGTVHRPDIRAVWAAYARTAREIKRRLRAERR